MIVDAMRFNEEGDNAAEVVQWALGKKVKEPRDSKNWVYVNQVLLDDGSGNCVHEIATRTADGVIKIADAGDWVIKGEHQEVHFCDHETFEKIYEPLILH
jgi:hypothetical protein